MFWLFICGGGGGGQLGGGVGVENTPQVGGGVGVLPRLSPKARFSSERSEAVKSSLLNLPLSWTIVLAVTGRPFLFMLAFTAGAGGCMGLSAKFMR